MCQKNIISPNCSPSTLNVPSNPPPKPSPPNGSYFPEPHLSITAVSLTRSFWSCIFRRGYHGRCGYTGSLLVLFAAYPDTGRGNADGDGEDGVKCPGVPIWSK